MIYELDVFPGGRSIDPPDDGVCGIFYVFACLKADMLPDDSRAVLLLSELGHDVVLTANGKPAVWVGAVVKAFGMLDGR